MESEVYRGHGVESKWRHPAVVAGHPRMIWTMLRGCLEIDEVDVEMIHGLTYPSQLRYQRCLTVTLTMDRMQQTSLEASSSTGTMQGCFVAGSALLAHS